jgi:hypothetical protein
VHGGADDGQVPLGAGRGGREGGDRGQREEAPHPGVGRRVGARRRTRVGHAPGADGLRPPLARALPEEPSTSTGATDHGRAQRAQRGRRGRRGQPRPLSGQRRRAGAGGRRRARRRGERFAGGGAGRRARERRQPRARHRRAPTGPEGNDRTKHRHDRHDAYDDDLERDNRRRGGGEGMSDLAADTRSGASAMPFVQDNPAEATTATAGARTRGRGRRRARWS